jgi:hypothetical protein
LKTCAHSLFLFVVSSAGVVIEVFFAVTGVVVIFVEAGVVGVFDFFVGGGVVVVVVVFGFLVVDVGAGLVEEEEGVLVEVEEEVLEVGGVLGVDLVVVEEVPSLGFTMLVVWWCAQSKDEDAGLRSLRKHKHASHVCLFVCLFV